MDPRALRSLGFVAVCLIFGGAAWLSSLDERSIRAQFAAAEAPSSDSVLTGSNKQCPPEKEDAKYRTDRPPNQTFSEYVPGKGYVPIRNLYGKPCFELSKTVFVQGTCTRVGYCKGEQYVGQDGKLHKVENPGQNPGKIQYAQLGNETANDGFPASTADLGTQDNPLTANAKVPGSSNIVETSATPNTPVPTQPTGPSTGQTVPSNSPISTGPPLSSPTGNPGQTTGPVSNAPVQTGQTQTPPSTGNAPPTGSTPAPTAWQQLQQIGGYQPPNYSFGGNPPPPVYVPSNVVKNGVVYLAGNQVPQALPSTVAYGRPVNAQQANNNANTTFNTSPSPQTPFPKDDSYERLAMLAEQRIAADNAAFEKQVAQIIAERFPEQARASGIAADGFIVEGADGIITTPLSRITESVTSGVQTLWDGVADLFASFLSNDTVTLVGEEKKIPTIEIDSGILIAGDPRYVLAEVPDGPLGPPQQPFFGNSEDVIISEEVATQVSSGENETVSNNEGGKTQSAGTEKTDESSGQDMSVDEVPTIELPSLQKTASEQYESSDEYVESTKPVGIAEKISNGIEKVVATVGNAVKAAYGIVSSWF